MWPPISPILKMYGRLIGTFVCFTDGVSQFLPNRLCNQGFCPFVLQRVTRYTPAEAIMKPTVVTRVNGSPKMKNAIIAVVGGTKNNNEVVAATLSRLIKIIKIT